MADDATVEVETTETTEVTTAVETTATDELEKWKALSRKNERDAKRLQAELEKAQQASMSEQEKAVAIAKAEGRAEALRESNRKLLHAEVRAAAAGVLADPDDAIHLLDLEQFETDGDIDRKAIRSALDQLAKQKPYLAAGPGAGAGEGGPRGSTVTTQRTPADEFTEFLQKQLK